MYHGEMISSTIKTACGTSPKLMVPGEHKAVSALCGLVMLSTKTLLLIYQQLEFTTGPRQ